MIKGRYVAQVTIDFHIAPSPDLLDSSVVIGYIKGNELRDEIKKIIESELLLPEEGTVNVYTQFADAYEAKEEHHAT